MLRAKNVVFAFIAVMTAYVFYHNERFLISPSDPEWAHIETFKWYLLPHGVAGACALLLAPLQFSTRLRQRFTKTHRVVGRIYVAGVFILAPLGLYIQYFEEGMGFPRSFTVLTVVDATLLITTTSVAFLFALRRNIPMHRQWMTRSYAVALVFFEGRFLSGVLGLDTASVEVGETIIWSCVAFSLLFADLANNWQELRGTRVAARSAPVPARAPMRDVELA